MSPTSELPLAARIDAFFAASPIGVVGASSDRSKYGYRCLAALLEKGFHAIPVNPRAEEILGVPAVASVTDLPADARAINVITPPAISAQVLAAAIERGITHVWFQPGAEPDDVSLARAAEAGTDVIVHGPCILVALASR